MLRRPSRAATAQIAINHDYGFDGALFVGYDLGAFRLEAEVAYKRADVDDIETVDPASRAIGWRPAVRRVTPTIFAVPAAGAPARSAS